nr:DUF2478 domain-containing protein [uncultured Rhodopila sp.]
MRQSDTDDIAARVGILPYGSSGGPDAVVSEAVARLRARGIAVAGLLQRSGGAAPGGKQTMWVEDIRTGQRIRLDQPRGPGAIACTFDTGALAQAAYLLQLAAESGAELVVVNRFGSVEAEGRGLRSEIAAAICAGLAVLIPVRASLLPELEAFLGGSATCLPASVRAIEDWAETALLHGRSPAVVA